MKKILIKSLIFLVICFILYWATSYIKCETLTLKHGNEFKTLYKYSGMIAEIDYLKVLDYSNTTAKIYYVSKDECGNLMYFLKKDDEWKSEKWETIWSSSGGADGFVWPYIR